MLFLRGNALYAIAFDVATLKTTGAPVPVVSDVHAEASNPQRGIDVSQTGTLVYRRASSWRWPRQLVMRTREGRVEPVVARTGSFSEPRLSPDGSMILFTSQGAHREI